jgi:hypothetical protein
MENDAMYDDQDKELAEAIEGLKAQDESLDEENYEDIRDLQQQEPEMPDIELKLLPKGLKYELLGADKTYPVIVSDELTPEEMDKLLNLLRKHKKVIGYSISDLKGISPAFCIHRIPLEEQSKPVVEPQRRLSHAMREVVKKEVIKLLDVGIEGPIRRTREGGSEWEPIKILLEGDRNSNKLKHSFQHTSPTHYPSWPSPHSHWSATGPRNQHTTFRPENAAKHQPRVH